jgi:hypothetical protein
MYQWEDDVYEKLTNSEKNYQSAERIVDHATKFEFKAGDLYFMDESKWHIGYSAELSIGLAFWFNHFDRNELMGRLNTYIKDKLLVEKTKRLDAFLDNKDKTGKIDFPLNTTNPYKHHIEKFYQGLYEDYQLEMLSNGGFYQPAAKLPERDDIRLTHSTKIHHPFKIHYRVQSDEMMTLFIRAHQVQIPNHPDLPHLIDKLNSGEIFGIHTLTESLLEDWSDDVVLYIINLMYTHDAIEILAGAPVKMDEASQQLVSEAQ